MFIFRLSTSIPRLCASSSTSREVWDSCTKVLELIKDLVFPDWTYFYHQTANWNLYERLYKALWCLQSSLSGSVELSFKQARTTVTKSIPSEGEAAIHDTSRRGEAVAEVALTWGRLAEWEQRHTVTCWWINTQNFLWGHYSYPPPPPKKSRTLALLCSVCLFLEMCCLTQCVSTGDYFLTSSLLFALFSLLL